MFPTWSDWDIKYTTKGLIKQRAKKLFRILAFTGAVTALIRMHKNPPTAASIKGLLRNYVKFSLASGVSLFQGVEKRI